MLSTHEEKIELPAEWEPQSATLLTWPHIDSDWNEHINEVENVYLEICKAISRHQKLLIVCRDEKLKDSIINKFDINKISTGSYLILTCNYNDTWCRDYGPLTVRCDGTLELRNFIFNGWGNKRPAKFDNLVTQHLHKQEVFGSIELQNYDFILEGGSIDSDGHGTILTTSRCTLKRHPEKNKTDLELLFKKYLGAKKVHWIDHGELLGDDTDGHIDMLARFVNPKTIVYSACNDKSNPNYESMKKMQDELSSLQQDNGESYHLIPIVLPKPKTNNGQTLPASYINFLITNQTVLVPTYDDPQDHVALEIFKQCFPNRDVVGINSNTLITQNGSLHCATMQIPAGVLNLPIS